MMTQYVFLWNVSLQGVDYNNTRKIFVINNPNNLNGSTCDWYKLVRRFSELFEGTWREIIEPIYEESGYIL